MLEMVSKRRRIRLKTAGLVLAATTWWPGPVFAEDLLFESTQVLHLTIRAPLKSLSSELARPDHVAGSIELTDGVVIPVSIQPYGTSRPQRCTMPLFKLEIENGDTDGSVFEGLDVLRLVTPCHLSSSCDRYALLEYLVYASYAIVAEPALRVRLVSCRFLDSQKPSFEQTRLAFFVEEIGDAAARHHTTWLDLESQGLEDLDPEQLAILALFQFMIGNTDWSAVAAAEGLRCCHNIAVLGGGGDPHNLLLPFDFDQAGLVDAPYAQPDRTLGINSVKERVYRGFCAHNDYLPEAIALFNEVRPRLEELFSREDLPEPKHRKRALKYIGSFYETINNPLKVENRLLNRCR
jgi:hypothetical protein